jgi:hypothetical protein
MAPVFGETVVCSEEECLCVDIEFESAAKLSATLKLKAGNAWVKLVKPSLEFESPAYFIRESGYWTAEKITNGLEAGVYVAKELPMRFYRKLDGGDSCRKLVDLAGVELASIYRSDNAIERFQASSSPTTLGLGRALAWRSKFSLSVD